MSTFIGNHDLPRSIHYAEQTLPSWLGSNAQGAHHERTGERLDGRSDDRDRRDHVRAARRGAFAVLFTNKGAPLIYYGDEIGLPGAGDPDNRRTMTFTGWSAAQQGLHDRIAALLAIRAAHPAMRRGTRATVGTTSLDLWIIRAHVAPATATPSMSASTGATATSRAPRCPAGLPELLAGRDVDGDGDHSGAPDAHLRAARLRSDAGADGGLRS